MKKILGVSLVALLAVSPMMANAAQSAASLSAADIITTGTTPDTTALATAAYVKGAYNAAKDGINNIVTDIDVTTNGSAMNGNSVMLNSASSVAENLANIDTKIGSVENLTSGAIIDNSQSVSANLRALENAINSDKTSIDNTIGTVSSETNWLDSSATVAANLEALDTEIGVVAAGTNYLDSSATVAANLEALDTKVKLNADHIGDMDSGLSGFTAGTDNLVDAVNQAMAEAKAGTGANTVVAFADWNSGGVPAGAQKLTTMTDSAADGEISAYASAANAG